MSPVDESLDDEDFAQQVLAMDEALARGEPLPALSELPSTPESAERLRHAQECLLLLNQDCQQQLCETPRPEATVEIEVASEPLPESIGRFQIVRELGRGAFGIVYLADDPRTRRWVALKVPRREALFSHELRQRFVREGWAAAQLDHPNLVTVYEVGEAGPFTYLVLRYCPAGNLADFLRQNKTPIDPRTAAGVVARLADAVQTMHDRDMHHRDIKPSNVLLEASPENNGKRSESADDSQNKEEVVSLENAIVRLGDFGLIKLQAELAGETLGALTKSQQILGTPQYMSPEQARGKANQVGAAADLYSLGALLYELLTGRVPLRGDSDVETLQLVASEEPVLVRALRPSVPRDLETIVHKCLRKEPPERYGSARELSADLHRFLDGRPVLARPQSSAVRMVRWSRRNRALAATAAAALLLSIGVVVGVFAWAADTSSKRAEILNAFNKSQLRIAESYLDRGIGEADRGDVALGMSWMARALETAPPDAKDIADAARANLQSWGQSSFYLTSYTGTGPGESVLAFTTNPPRAWIGTKGSNLIKIRDVVTGRNLDLTLHHPPSSRVWRLAASRTGNMVATGSEDGTVRLWNATSGGLQKELVGKGCVTGLAFPPDGKFLVVGRQSALGEPAGTDIGMCYLKEAPAAVPVVRLNYKIRGLFIATDGKTLMVIPDQKQMIDRFEMSTGRNLGPILQHPGNILSADLSPDGTLLLTGGEDRTARLWHVGNGRQLQVLYHRQAVCSVGFDSDGQRLLTAGVNDALRTWIGATSPKPVQTIQLPEPARVLEQSPNGEFLVTGSDDFQARLWKAGPAGIESAGRLQHPHPLAYAAFHPTTSQLAISTQLGGDVFLWDVEQQRLIGRLAHEGPVRRIAYSTDGERLATASYDASVRIWSTSSFQEPLFTLKHPQQVMCVAFSPDGKALASGGDDGHIRVWHVSTGQLLAESPDLGSAISAVAYSPDGMMIGSGSDDGVARRWTSGMLKLMPPEHLHGDRVRTICFSMQGHSFLSGSWDNTTRIWDSVNGEARGIALRHHGRVLSVEFSSDGAYVATASGDGTARVWHALTGRPLGPPLSHADRVELAKFDRKLNWIATCGIDGGVRLWPMPKLAPGSPSSLTTWVQSRTGIELDSGEGIHVLDPQNWEERKKGARERSDSQ